MRILPLQSLTGIAVALLLVDAPPVIAQSGPFQPIGTISGGNKVLVETKTVKRTGDEITATLRVPFEKPAKVRGEEWYGSRTLVSVRCTGGTVAVKENRYYSDAQFAKVASEKIVKIPGYAKPVPGSAPAVAMTHFCKPATP